jgi:ParB family chromosome partitioning protein
MSEYKHSSEEQGWITPPEVIERARQAMGSIDLDPASSKVANQFSVRAKRIYTESQDGLKCKWSGNVWLNPPFGTLEIEGKTRSSADIWMSRCVDQWAEGGGDVQMMITLFNAATSAKWFAKAWEHCLVCFPHRRIQFIDPVTMKVQTQNQYANAIMCWAPDTPSERAFFDAFADYGNIVAAYI